jgi:FkbM family methyltransferase
MNRLYPYERGKLDEHEFTVRVKTGSLFRGNTTDFHAHPVGVRGYGEWRNLAIALALCRPGDLIVEVGANVGTETVGYSDVVGAGGSVVAFEPLPSNRTAVERLLPALRYPNVTLLPHALSDRNETTSFAVPPISMSQGTGHLLGAEERRSKTTIYYYESIEMELIEVQCRMLDEFADMVRGVRLLFADVEGAEIALLRGARRALEADRPSLVLEASNPHLRRAGLSGVEDLGGAHADLRYRAFEIGRLDLIEVNTSAMSRQYSPQYSQNWLCLPEERVELLDLARGSLRRCGLMPGVMRLNPMTRMG